MAVKCTHHLARPRNRTGIRKGKSKKISLVGIKFVFWYRDGMVLLIGERIGGGLGYWREIWRGKVWMRVGN